MLACIDMVMPGDTGFMKVASAVPARNAAIALARLAQDEACKAQLRELDGLRIMYQKIRP